MAASTRRIRSQASPHSAAQSRSLFRLCLLLAAIIAPSAIDSRSQAADETKAAVSGEAEISIDASGSPIVIKTTNRLAGAIDSLTWNGKEFVDSFDHGRQIQSAATFDAALPGEFWPERFNPTEAGSRLDGVGPTSTSRLLEFHASDKRLESKTQMAYWLAPGEKSFGRLAINDAKLSNHIHSKVVTLGKYDSPHLIDFEITFTVPAGEKHRLAQFEALTGYMPPEFSRFLAIERNTGRLLELSEGPGEQQHPVILSTPSGSHAMGVFSPDQPSIGFEHAGYGRFLFKQEQVVKWNCVFRVRDEENIAPGEYRYQIIVAVGDLETVKRELTSIAAPRS
jgi:hypothetical protein